MRPIASFLSVCLVALAVVGVGCSSDDDTGPPAGSFYGLYADAIGAHGTITLSGVAAATAPLVLGGGPSIPLAGTLDISGELPIVLTGLYTESGALSFASEGDTYTFTGQVTQGTASGTSTGPNGAGTFILFTGGTPAATLVYCGEASCSPDPCETPIAFNLAVSSGTALLTAFAEGAVVSAVGTRTGDNVSIHVVSGGIDVLVQGAINGPLIGGTWADNVNQTNGLWNGGTGQCSATAVRSAKTP